MANESIRIRTTPGNSKNIRVKLEQDFDFLEIMSLKISQEDLYQTFCSNYGVVVGRVIANKGFGLPNAKISVFIPITSEDQKNTLIKDLYPFKTPYQKNNNIRYNLLLSKSTCFLNKAVGTFPSKEEVLDNDTVLEVFDKYYKYTTKTNNAGDFMIFGAPVGQYTIHMDVDLSDAGAASVRPYDMIANGYPEKLFDSNTEFKTATNLDSLPQIKSGNIGVDIIPFWGDTENCEIGITRVDFDTNFEIKTTALFFGSIFTDSGKDAINKGCNPRNTMGEEDNLRTGEGRIDMIRVKDYDTLDWYNNGNIKPASLEKWTIEGGELIDSDGTFAFPVPMNLGHVITDEFGNLVPSADPSIGIATKAMYRFKMKFTEPNENPKYRTATILFPSLGADFGGTQGMVDTGNIAQANGTQDQRWTDDITEYDTTVYPNARIFLDFHTFEWKQLYTIAHYIKKYKVGLNRFSFLGVKNTDVSAETNLFPFTNAVWKFDIVYYIIAFFIDVVAFFLKLLIILVSICIKFCAYAQISWGTTVVKINIGFSFVLLDFCYQICPFAWLGGLIPQFTLPCEDAPNGEGYDIPSTGGTWASCNPNGCGGSTFGCSCSSVGASNPCSSCNFCFKVETNGINTADNICLQDLINWKCCAKLRAAEQRNVIRRNFNDAWVFGTAYLFQFKYKKNRSGSKEKFCGPGADHVRGKWYGNNNCCLDTKPNFNNATLVGECTKCLLRGPNEGTDPSASVGILGSCAAACLATGFLSPYCLACIYAYYTGSGDVLGAYHVGAHNASRLPDNNGKIHNGAADINEIIYCNALMSTKIVSVGRIEMCEETLEEITTASQAGQALHIYAQNPNFYTGTFYENGWDPGFWVSYLQETSYQSPQEVLFYLLKQNNCNPRELFYGSGLIDGYPCHEFELKDNPTFFMKEISKIHVDQEVGVNDEFNPPSGTVNPYGDLVNNPPVYGGFLVNKLSGSRFSPCGNNPSNCYGQPSNNWINTGTAGVSSPDINEADNDGWDRYISRGNRNNPNVRANVPYYYFGITPGKTAINKLKKNYFFRSA